MLSATFDDQGGANNPAFSVDLTSSTANFRSPEILKISVTIAIPLRVIVIPVFHYGLSDSEP